MPLPEYFSREEYNTEQILPQVKYSSDARFNETEIGRGVRYAQEERRALGATNKRPAPQEYKIYSSYAEEKLIDRARSVPRVGIVVRDPALDNSQLTMDTTVKTHGFSIPDPTDTPPVRSQAELRERRAARYQEEANRAAAEAALYFKPKSQKYAEYQDAMNRKAADLAGQNASRQLMTREALMLARRQEMIDETKRVFDDRFTVKKDIDKPPWELDEQAKTSFINAEDATWKPYHDRGGLYSKVLKEAKTRLLYKNYREALARSPPCQASSEGDVLVPVPFQLADQPPGTIQALSQQHKRNKSDSNITLSIARSPFPESTLPEVYRPIKSVFSQSRSKELNQKSFLECVKITETPEDYAPMYSSFTRDNYYREPMLPQIRSNSKAPAPNLISQKHGRHIYILPDAAEQISTATEQIATARLLTAPLVLFE